MNDNDKLVQVAMQIILHAGNARKLSDEAFDLAIDKNYEQAFKKQQEANEELKQAHQAQTDIIQEEARGNKQPYSMLFSHAQDTLMTIMSELNTNEKIMRIMKEV